MRAFRSVVLAAASVLAMPVAVGVSLVPVAAAAQQVPVIRVGQTLTGVFDGSEPMFDNQYLLRGYELTLRRGETVTVSLSSRDVIAIPLVIGANDFNALPEDDSPETVTFTAPAAGTYTIAVLGTEASRGTFTISVRSGRQAAAAPPPPPPPPPPPGKLPMLPPGPLGVTPGPGPDEARTGGASGILPLGGTKPGDCAAEPSGKAVGNN